MNRTFLILNEHQDAEDLVQKTIDVLFDSDVTNSIYVATTVEQQKWNISKNNITCQNVVLPTECDTQPKRRNWLNQYFKTQQFNGFLHVLEDNIEFLKNPTEFLNEIENAMTVLDYPVWFNTICDPCNYVYKKYNPRLNLAIDDMRFAQLNLTYVLFTSHSNTVWIAYDFSKVTDDNLKFNDSFIVPMYWIIEFLARRRNTKSDGQLYYMNQYMTVKSEYGTFKTADRQIKQLYETTQELMQKEDAMFKQLNINYQADNNVDILLETLYQKLKQKAS